MFRDLTVFRHSRKMRLSANPVDNKFVVAAHNLRNELRFGLLALSGELP